METINTWGLLGPEFILDSRRTRSLELGASIRLFNDLAVPGLGGVWFGKQLLLALLGILVAEQARKKNMNVQNIEVANAIEAIACWGAFKNNGWKSDARLRGNTKLHGKNDFSFNNVRQRNFYVTQPMRMATVQSLPALGFVESDGVRFNGFRCSDVGESFIRKATENYRPFNSKLVDYLTSWTLGKTDRIDTDTVQRALSPLIPLSNEVVPLLHDRVIRGGNESKEDRERRANALSWVENIRTNKSGLITWKSKPNEISNQHWNDLKAGALFFSLRNAAITTLDAMETYLRNQTTGANFPLSREIPVDLKVELQKLRSIAQAYLDERHWAKPAKDFGLECVNDSCSSILRSLVKRDGNVLRLVGDEIKPGPAFRSSVTTAVIADEQETQIAENTILPEGISYRVRNLYLLNLDMHGELDQWLNPSTVGEDL